ncbi:MAG TPA: CarD family transcriptional regulator, partial [Bdellovibrionales bacterium]|nr:CarD family transcriptional regulator [Bdellovibrionales bacterium]
MKFDPLSLHIEKILERSVRDLKLTELEVIGTDSTLAVAMLLTQMSSPELVTRPRLIVVPNAKSAEALEAHLRFFAPSELSISILPAFDVSPYSGLYPNSRLVSERVRWAFNAQSPKPGQIFIAPISALLQRTIPGERLKKAAQSFKVGADLPSQLTKSLNSLGYQSVPIVEDEGTFAIRGGIVDIYSPAHRLPVRIELFGDTIDSLRFFNPETQRSEQTTESFTIIPPREIVFDDDARMRASRRYRENVSGRNVDETEKDSILQSLTQGQLFPGLEFLIGDFYEDVCFPLSHFGKHEIQMWLVNPIDIDREADHLLETLRREYKESVEHPIRPAVTDLFTDLDRMPRDQVVQTLSFSKIEVQDAPHAGSEEGVRVTFPSLEVKLPPTTQVDSFEEILKRIHSWREQGFAVFVAAGTQAQAQRLSALLERGDFHPTTVGETDGSFESWRETQQQSRDLIHIVPRSLRESLRLNEEQIIFLRDEDFFGRKQKRRDYKQKGSLVERTHAMNFGDLKPGDAVVHILHGIGTYEGLKVMPIGGVDAEFITLSYKDGDKLYLPIYRINQIQKYSGPGGERLIDKLGGTQWQKVTGRVRNHLREIASDLLDLYAKRSQVHRPPFPKNDEDFAKFEAAFPYDETDDQLKAVDDIVGDMTNERPMDRLVCGDVGFGKTEVAMRAAFKAVEGKKQVAVLAPTTVLSFQHLETFQKRFKQWPITVRALNRFVSNADA